MTRTILNVVWTWRTLRFSPSLLIWSTATLAAGVATLLTGFAVVDAALLRDLPYPNGDRIIEIWAANNATGLRLPRLNTAVVAELETHKELFRGVAGYQFEGTTLTGLGPAEIVGATRVGAPLLAQLGVTPLRGRLFTAEDALDGAAPVVIISEHLWNARFGSRNDILTQVLEVDGTRHRIVGILPSTFRFPETSTAVWRPLMIGTKASVQTLAIMAPQVTPVSLDARLGVLSSAWRAAGLLEPRTTLVTAEPIQRRYNRRYSIALYAVLGAVAALYLVAVLNIAGLLLVRTAGRQQQYAVATAIGARSADLVTILASEAAALCVAGTMGGVALAFAAARLVEHVLPPEFMWLAASQPRIDGRALSLATISLGVSWAVVCAPSVLRISRLDIAGTLQRSAGSHSGPRRMLHTTIVALQLTLAMLLVVTGGLLIRSFVKLTHVDPGYEVAKLLVIEVQFPDASTASARQAVLEELRVRLRALANIRRVSFSAGAPPGGGGLAFDVHPAVDGGPTLSGFEHLVLPVTDAAPNYFETMGIDIVAGRAFTGSDSPDVVIVNDVFARRLWGTVSPIGHRLRLDSDWSWHEVVGVARDVRTLGPDESAAADMELYLPYRLGAQRFCSILIRTTTEDVDGLVKREAERLVAAIDPHLPIVSAQTMAERLHDSLSRQRFLSGLASIVAALGLFLSAAGVFSITSYWVVCQRKELAIRSAVGASPRRLLTLVLRRATIMAAMGVMAGAALAMAANRALASLLFEVGSDDPVTYASALILLLAIVFLAAVAPARTASRINPAEALRS
jgi:putative ABC transport system permease protein